MTARLRTKQSTVRTAISAARKEGCRVRGIRVEGEAVTILLDAGDGTLLSPSTAWQDDEASKWSEVEA